MFSVLLTCLIWKCNLSSYNLHYCCPGGSNGVQFSLRFGSPASSGYQITDREGLKNKHAQVRRAVADDLERDGGLLRFHRHYPLLDASLPGQKIALFRKDMQHNELKGTE